jgi:hypothetical protein
MWTPHVPQNPEGRSHYGYGWVVTRTSRGTGLVWHNGSNGIFYAELRRYPDEGVVMIISSNVAEASAEAALPGPVRLTFGLPYTPPPAAHSADPTAAAAAAGTYRLATGGTITVSAREGRLTLTPEGAGAFAVTRGSAPSAALDSIGRRTVVLLDAMTRGELQPLHEAMNGQVPLDALRGMSRQSMEAMGLGEPVGTELLGVLAGRGTAVEVLARLRFERGAGLLRVEWSDGVVAGLDIAQALPAAPVFLPAADGGWISYDLQTAETVRLRFENGGMVVDTPSGPVRATRAQ